MKRLNFCEAVLSILIVLSCISTGWARARLEDNSTNVYPRTSDILTLLHSRVMSHVAVHDAGDLYSPFIDGIVSTGFSYSYVDPETGQELKLTTYPRGSGKQYIYAGGIWVGGIVNQDTLVSVALDGWFPYKEIHPENYRTGGTYRVGHFADDEFVTVGFDTFHCTGFDPCDHKPLGLKITQTTHSWADTVYDDFIIIDYTVKNTGMDYITDAWIGFYLDGDVAHESVGIGYMDDCSGLLDTLLYEGDSASRAMVAYIFDNDGDPGPYRESWDSGSVEGVISLRLLDADFEIEHQNFNWWCSNGNPSLDFGPRRVGTPEYPYRPFGGGGLGTPGNDKERYYILSHPEIDYNQLETAIHDSADGWIPPSLNGAIDFSDGWDTRFLLSFGSFNLLPGDSVNFSLALAAADNFHVNPDDFDKYFNSQAPDIFQNKLDFSKLLIYHGRADSVYRSGLTVPHPGPPSGLTVTDYDDDFVDLVWNASGRPDLAGYYLFARDTVLDNIWRHAFIYPIVDTVYRCYVAYPDHNYCFAVSLVDNRGRESGLSLPVEIIPAMPHPPECLEITLDGIIPVLTWSLHVDTATQWFMIYRAVWDSTEMLYDSTRACEYRDYNAESGEKYSYRVSAKNDLGLESEKVGPVQVIPMAMDQGTLFVDRNLDRPGNYIAFQREYLDRLYESVAAYTPTARHNVDDSILDIRTMADYSPLIFDVESRMGSIWWPNCGFLRLYLEHGGKAIFIILSASDRTIRVGQPVTEYFEDGDFFHDILKLDSAVTNNINFDNVNRVIYGDLFACRPLVSEYQWLYADTNKFGDSYIPIEGYIPMSGYLFPTDEAEPIYGYISSNPDAVNHGRINGIRYLGDDYSFILFNFPLSLMVEPGNFDMMRQALNDLGVLPTAVDEGPLTPLPGKFTLRQNYPNPFNPVTTIEFYNPESKSARVTLEIFNILGQKITALLDGPAEPGLNKIEWDSRDRAGRPVASGIYIYRLKADDFTATRKMLLLR